MMDMSMAPSGMAMPSESISMKSSQQSFQPAMPSDWPGTHTPLEPSPSKATSAASTRMARQTYSTTRPRLAVRPFWAARSMKNVATTSTREMAEEMAAMRTSR